MKYYGNIPSEEKLLYLKLEELISRFQKGDCIAALAFHALYYERLYDISIMESSVTGFKYRDTLLFMRQVMGGVYNLKLQ